MSGNGLKGIDNEDKKQITTSRAMVGLGHANHIDIRRVG
jgi:hypothetical protein